MRNLGHRLVTMLALCASLLAVQPADAALTGRSTVLDAGTGGHPTWYQDSAGVAAAPCLDNLGFCGIVPGPGFNGTLPVTYPGNIPEEWFYWSATAIFTVNGAPALVVLALEATYVDQFGVLVPPATPGAKPTTFQRMRIVLDNAPAAGTYTIEHPWGATTFTCASAGLCKSTRDLGGAVANDFDTALGIGTFTPPDSSMSTFLEQASTVPPAGYFGDGATIGIVSGGTVRNRVDILSPGSLNIGGTNLFAVTGKKFGMEVEPTDIANGAIVIPATAAPQTVTVSNPNTVSPLTIAAAPNGLVLSGTRIADYTIGSDTCSGVTLPAAVPPAAPPSCTFTVTYHPLPVTPEVASRTAVVTVSASAPANTPPGHVHLSGTAQYPVTALAGSKGTITGTAVTALAANAGSTPIYTVTPKQKWQVKDISVNGVVQNISAIRPTNPTQPVVFTAPAVTGPQDISATFMPSGNVTGSGTLGVADAVKALRIMVGIQSGAGDDLEAMKVYPLDSQGRPSGLAGTPDLNDIVLILKRVLGIVTW